MCNSAYSTSPLYNLLPPVLRQQKLSPNCTEANTGADPSLYAGPSSSSTSSTSPNFENSQRFDSSLSSDDLPFSRPSLCLPPLRGSTSNRQQHRISTTTSEYQRHVDYNTDSGGFQRCPPTSVRSGITCNEEVFSSRTFEHIGINNQVTHSDALSSADVIAPRHMSTADDLYNILNSGDYVASLIGNGHTAPIGNNGGGLSVRTSDAPNSSIYGFINDPLSLTMVEFISNTCAFDRQLLSQHSRNETPRSTHNLVNSQFIANPNNRNNCNMLMRDCTSPGLLDGLGFPNSQMMSSPASISSGRKRAFSDTVSNLCCGMEAKKRNRRRHEPTIAAAQAIVDASLSIKHSDGVDSGFQLSQRNLDVVELAMNFNSRQLPPNTVMQNPSSDHHAIKSVGLQHCVSKIEDPSCRVIGNDVEESSTRSNSAPLGFENDDPVKLKVERKRARNRLAARRCRERKVSLIMSLENRVSELNIQIKSLELEVDHYRSEAHQLRHRLDILAESFPSLREHLLTLTSPNETSSLSSSIPSAQRQQNIIRPSLIEKVEQN